MNRKNEILEELRRSRKAIARDSTSIVAELNLTSKIRRSVTRRPLAWLGSAAAVGYILAGPKTRKAPKPVSTKKGAKPEKPDADRGVWHNIFSILFRLAKFLVPLFRPALSAYAAQRLGELSTRFSR
jgi:hypothetical protein